MTENCSDTDNNHCEKIPITVEEDPKKENNQELEYYVSDIQDDEANARQLVIHPEWYVKSKYPPDVCFLKKKVTDSHGWIFDDDIQEDVTDKSVWLTEMKQKYGLPEKLPNLDQGIRSQVQYKEALEEAIKEIEEEERKKTELKVEEYCSEYDSNYGAGINFKRLTDDKEYMDSIKTKYPLYRTPTMTIYRHTYLSQPSDMIRQSIPGMTLPVNSEMLWNKYNGFTTPVDLLTKEPPGGL